MERQFLVMVEMPGTAIGLSEKLVRSLEGAVSVRPRSFDWMGNWIQIADNDDYDPAQVDEPRDGFLFYRFRLEVSPMKSVDVEHQVRVAVALSDALRALGAKTAVCADFEEKLPAGY